jgi:hypothetical protein
LLNVFLTVDTEIWPEKWEGWDAQDYSEAMTWSIYGRTPYGEAGLLTQLDLLEKHRLKAVFFVEALCASALGMNPLKSITEDIHHKNQEVQLHLHPEWIEHIRTSQIRGFNGPNMAHYDLSDQISMLEEAASNLKACGVENPISFRAGNFGANLQTLQSLVQLGFVFDSSYNPNYPHCSLNLGILQATRVSGIVEVPVSVFADWSTHLRPAQLCACSFEEMSYALLRAWHLGWKSFVIVLHSFELLNSARKKPDKIVIGRFKRLCRFLDYNRDKFQTRHFSDIEPDEILFKGKAPSIQSGLVRTLPRVFEQIVRKFQ